MNRSHIIKKTAEYVKENLEGAEGGHDWWHVYRVWNNAKMISANEEVDMFVVELAALLHDIADSKFHNGHEEIGVRIAKNLLTNHLVDGKRTEHVLNIIQNISYRDSFETSGFKSLELDVVQDADRLEAMGAIGIARAFHYGGFKDRLIFDPDILPKMSTTKEEYQSNEEPSINHFYDKLLVLKEKMNTKKGKELATHRHDFMLEYLTQFHSEAGNDRWPN